MFSFKCVSVICLGATLCAAQTINISGKIVDTAGVEISGVLVKLEHAKISTTSGPGGAFTLSNIPVTTRHGAISGMTATFGPRIRAGNIQFALSGLTPVAISIHDVGGRLVSGSTRTLGPGTYSMSLPRQPAGIFLCNVTIGNEAYVFKASSFGAFSTEHAVVPSGTYALAKQAKATVEIHDIIAATKTGWLNYRCVIGNWDTSGVVIKMIANAGDLTDIDGNVYQTVRIGNQVWMAGKSPVKHV